MGRSKGRGKGGGAKAAQAASGTESTKKWSVEEDKMFLKRSKELIKEGNKHFQQAKLEHARQSYEKALQLCKGHRKESAQLHSNLGAILLLQHKFDEAIQECTLSLELDQYNVTTRRRRARAHELTGNLIGALIDVRWLIRIHAQAPAKLREPFVAFERKLIDQIKQGQASRNQAPAAAEQAAAKQAPPVGVKLQRGDEVRLVEVRPDVSYADLKSVCLQKFDGLGDFNVTAKDEDGDVITLRSREDVSAALKLATNPKFLVSEVDKEAEVVAPPAGELDQTKVPPNLMVEETNLQQQQQQQQQQGKKKEEEVYELDDWMIDFAELFKEHLGIDIDTPLDLSKLAWEKCAEALDTAVKDDKSEALLRAAAGKFEEVIQTALVNLGNVHMCVARKFIDAKKEGEEGSVEVLKAAAAELDIAEGHYSAALGRRPDFADAVLSLGQLEFEKGKISCSFGAPEGHEYHADRAEGRFLSSIEKFKEALELVPPSPEGEQAAEGDQGEGSPQVTRAQALVMWGNALYEMSQILAGAKKEWKPTLELAVAKFVDAKCRREEVSAALEQHVGAGEIEKEKEKYLKNF